MDTKIDGCAKKTQPSSLSAVNTSAHQTEDIDGSYLRPFFAHIAGVALKRNSIGDQLLYDTDVISRDYEPIGSPIEKDNVAFFGRIITIPS